MKTRKERIDRGIKARSQDIFALCSWREMLYLAGPRVLPVVVCLALPLVLSVYWQKVLMSVAVFALLAISWDILSQSGMISLGQALFFGTGAYCSGIMNHYWGFSPLITLPLAAVFGGLISTVLLLPVLRLRGVYFSMVTLIIPLMLVRVIEATKIFGGTEGLSGMDPLPSAGFEVYLIIIVFLAVLFGFRRLMDSDYGLVLKGISDNDRSVINAGINIYWFKAQALFIAASIGAFAGAFMTHVYMFVGMPVFALDYSILPIAAAVVGEPWPGQRWAHSFWCRSPNCCGASGVFGSCSTGFFWWYASSRCRKAFFTIWSENIISSNAGSRWKNEHRAAS